MGGLAMPALRLGDVLDANAFADDALALALAGCLALATTLRVRGRWNKWEFRVPWMAWPCLRPT